MEMDKLTSLPYSYKWGLSNSTGKDELNRALYG